MEQDILIYIDEKEKLDSSVMANTFAHKEVRNRAYVNTLGAELALKYLVSENIDITNIKNIHSIKKVLENTDISDIMLPNIHIDVRVVFDENAIFIPKSHFDYNLVPDIYLVFNLSSDRTFVRFLGFFEPKLINKNNANADYYFIEKEKLSSSNDLINFIKSFNGKTDKDISDEEFEKSERFIIAMSDNDISDDDKKYLLKQLTKNAELRDRFIEYETFETLSYKAMNDPMIEKKEVPVIDTFDEITEPLDVPELEGLAIDESIADGEENSEYEEEITEPEETVELPLEEYNTNEEEEEEKENETENNLTDLSSNAELPQVDDIAETALNIEDTLDLGMDTISLDEELSLDEIKIPQEDVIADAGTTEDFIEPLDENINFEAIEVPEITESIAESSDETISLDNIELPQEQEEEQPNKEEMLALDDIELTDTIETLNDNDIETISLDNIDLPSEIPVEKSETANDLISLDNINIQQTSEAPSENVPEMDFTEIPDDIIEPSLTNEISDIIDNSLDMTSFDNIEENTSEDNQDIQTEHSFDELSQLSDVIVSDEMLENIQNETEQVENDSSFGKNLLENLSAEDAENNIETYAQTNDISSDDLLSQIEDVLGSTTSTEDSANNKENTLNTDIDELLNEENNLNILYNEETNQEEMSIPEEQFHTVPGANVYNQKPTSKKSSLVAGLLLISLLVATGFYFFKSKNDTSTDIEPITPNKEVSAIPQEQTAQDILETNAPAPEVKKEIQVKKEEVKELKNTSPVVNKTASESYLNINRLVWDVPDSLSYSSKMQNYLRTAGKSIKLSLSADLLLATEYAYSNQVKIGLTLNKNGSITDSKVLSTSGSSQIDNIVLQSVKDTLNVVKPPTDEIKDPDFKLNLIIYF